MDYNPDHVALLIVVGGVIFGIFQEVCIPIAVMGLMVLLIGLGMVAIDIFD